MNFTHIKLLEVVIHALCVISFHIIASTKPIAVERDSNLWLMHRFLTEYDLNLDLIIKVIVALLP